MTNFNEAPITTPDDENGSAEYYEDLPNFSVFPFGDADEAYLMSTESLDNIMDVLNFEEMPNNVEDILVVEDEIEYHGTPYMFNNSQELAEYFDNNETISDSSELADSEATAQLLHNLDTIIRYNLDSYTYYDENANLIFDYEI